MRAGRRRRRGAWQTGRVRFLRPALAAVLLTALPACSGPGNDAAPPAPAADHDDAGQHAHAAGPPAGDGTRAEEIGYRITDVALPRRAGAPGEVRFTVRTFEGEPLRDYVTEQTKDLHLYVVRTDLAVFRHLHPTIDEGGTWSAPLTLPEPGDFRVVADFVADDGGPFGDPVMLGTLATVPGRWTPRPGAVGDVGDDGVVNVRVEGGPALGPEGRMALVVRDARQRPVRLGTYLGTHAHVTGFHVESGSTVHLHPLGQPEVTEQGTRLEFHTGFTEPGDYVLFPQVRVDGFLHTLQVRAAVS